MGDLTREQHARMRELIAEAKRIESLPEPEFSIKMVRNWRTREVKKLKDEMDRIKIVASQRTVSRKT